MGGWRRQNCVKINAYVNAFKFSLCNIYAPDNTALENLTEILISKTDISNLITVGDWNATLEAVDKKGGIQWKPLVVFIEICLRSLWMKYILLTSWELTTLPKGVLLMNLAI